MVTNDELLLLFVNDPMKLVARRPQNVSGHVTCPGAFRLSSRLFLLGQHQRPHL